MSAGLLALTIVAAVLIRICRATKRPHHVSAPLSPEQRYALWRHRLDDAIGLNSEAHLSQVAAGIRVKRRLLADLARRHARHGNSQPPARSAQQRARLSLVSRTAR